MAFKTHISSLLRRQREDQRTEPAEADLRLLVPLTESLDLNCPQHGLLEGIEAELDTSQAQPARSVEKWCATLPLFLAFAFGALIALGISGNSRDGLEISIRSEADEAWLSLGVVTLRGAALHAFVAARCQDHSHLTIALTSGHKNEKPSLRGKTEPYAQPSRTHSGEKILMACNF